MVGDLSLRGALRIRIFWGATLGKKRKRPKSLYVYVAFLLPTKGRPPRHIGAKKKLRIRKSTYKDFSGLCRPPGGPPWWGISL